MTTKWVFFRPCTWTNIPWVRRALFFGLLCPALIALGEKEPPLHSDTGLCSRALLSPGDGMRLQQLGAKARRGEPLTVSVIGGSITQGASATKPELRYGNLVAAWWRDRFPGAQVQLINAGIGATGSDYGALRAQRDLLSHQPDFVIVEFAVNDPDTKEAAETLEGLLRQLLIQKNPPSVILLFMMNQLGQNAQNWFAKVGAHYHLPMVSYRDALWPEIEAHRLQWSDISPDAVHPNDRGHAYAARFITNLLETHLTHPPAILAKAEMPQLPEPYLSDLYGNTSLLEADTLKPLSNSGWIYDIKNRCWKSDQPGSAIEFEAPGTAILSMHYVVCGPMGRARVSVDNGVPQTLEGWFDQTWGGYRQTKEMVRNLNSGPHRVRFELIEEKNPQSKGHEFRILGLGSAGISIPQSKPSSTQK
jgi:lysophospholipase L1-like esterase